MDETLWFTLDDDRLTVAADEADVDDVEEFRTDDPTMAARAAALDDHDVYSAMFTRGRRRRGDRPSGGHRPRPVVTRHRGAHVPPC